MDRRICGERLAKVSLELGGKNPLVVCDDADLDEAVKWRCLSAFSNAGQRCAAGSRIIVFDAVYDAFRDKLVDARQGAEGRPGRRRRFRSRDQRAPARRPCSRPSRGARESGASVLAGGTRLTDPAHARGCYLAPTVIENAERRRRNLAPGTVRARRLLSIACRGYEEALALANDSPYGLTACIHTRSVDRGIDFSAASKRARGCQCRHLWLRAAYAVRRCRQSGNGTREPGTEALDVYSNLKNVYVTVTPGRV